MSETIGFFTTRGEWGFLSNFSRHPVTIYGHRFPTSEHSYQARKFLGTNDDSFERVLKSATPRAAAGWGRCLPGVSPRWDSKPSKAEVAEMAAPSILMTDLAMPDGIDRHGTDPELLFNRLKDIVMYEVVYLKMQQHEDLKQKLLSSGDANIVEASPYDGYWGFGKDGQGDNKLGRIYMLVRQKLAQETP